MFAAAFDVVCDELSSPDFDQMVGAHEADVAFLSELLNNTVVQSLIKVSLFRISSLSVQLHTCAVDSTVDQSQRQRRITV